MEIIIGAVVSLIVQFIKRYAGTSEYQTLGMVLLVSFVGAAGYVLLSGTPFWPVIMQVVVVAGAFYAYIIQRFQ